MNAVVKIVVAASLCSLATGVSFAGEAGGGGQGGGQGDASKTKAAQGIK